MDKYAQLSAIFIGVRNVAFYCEQVIEGGILSSSDEDFHEQLRLVVSHLESVTEKARALRDELGRQPCSTTN